MAKLILVVAIMFALQMVLSGLQMKHFSNEFIKLRRQGRVACGCKSGGFHAGAIAMFLIDDTGIIQAARKLEGVTWFARVRTLHGFEGKHIGQLTENDLPSGHKNLRKAILDASLNYNKFQAGQVIEQPPTPFGKAIRSIECVFRKQNQVN